MARSQDNLSYISDAEDEELVDSEGDVLLPDDSYPAAGASKSMQSDYGYGRASSDKYDPDGHEEPSYHQTHSLDMGPESWEVVEGQRTRAANAGTLDLSDGTLDAMMGHGDVPKVGGRAKPQRPTTAVATRRPPSPHPAEDSGDYMQSQAGYESSQGGLFSEEASQLGDYSPYASQDPYQSPGHVTYASDDNGVYDTDEQGSRPLSGATSPRAAPARPFSAGSQASGRSQLSNGRSQLSNAEAPPRSRDAPPVFVKESSLGSRASSHARPPEPEPEGSELSYGSTSRDEYGGDYQRTAASPRAPSARSSRPPSAGSSRPPSAGPTRTPSTTSARSPSAGSARPPSAKSGSGYSRPSITKSGYGSASGSGSARPPSGMDAASGTERTGSGTSGTERTTSQTSGTQRSASASGTQRTASETTATQRTTSASGTARYSTATTEYQESEATTAASTPATSRPASAASQGFARQVPAMPPMGRAQSATIGRLPLAPVAAAGSEEDYQDQRSLGMRPESPSPYEDPYEHPGYAYDSHLDSAPSSPLWIPGGQPRQPAQRRASNRSSGSPRARPTSASRARNEIHDIMERPPTTWDVRDVCLWVDHIGMAQYRKRFAHNCIDGRLLLALNDDHLKVELGIGPLGHRHAILEQIHILASEGGAASPRSPAGSPRRMHYRPQSAPSQRPRRPASARDGIIPPDSYLGPASGRVTVYEQRAKLLYEIERARARAAHTRAAETQWSSAAGQAEDEIKRLAGLLLDLERSNSIQVQHAHGSLDANARVPWHPVGLRTEVRNRFPERRGTVGDHPSVEETFKPSISKKSKEIMQESQGSYVAVRGRNDDNDPFLLRLKNDLSKRNAKLKNLEYKYYSKEAVAGSPEKIMKQKMKDLEFLSEVLRTRFQTDLPSDAQERDACLTEVVEDMLGKMEYGGESKNEIRQQEKRRLQRILKLQGDDKVAAVVGLFRTQQFMDRYTSDLKSKARRLENLERNYYLQVFKGRTKEDFEGNDMAKCYNWFAMLGWGSPDDGAEPVTDERLAALLKRATAYKAEYDKAREREREKPREQQRDPAPPMDWSAPQWRRDGLDELQDRQMSSILSSLEREAEAKAAAQKPSAVDEALGKTSSTSITIPPELMPRNHLHYTIKMLARCRADDLEKLEALTGRAKRLGVFRTIRTQQFLEDTAYKMAEKEAKEKEAIASMAFPQKVVSKEQLDEFYERLVADAMKRRERIEKAMSDKMQKEMEILKSSVLFNRSNRRRPASAR